MPGTSIFTHANIVKETTRGTPVAPTRKLYMEGTGVLDHDLGVSFHESELRGTRTSIVRATETKEAVAVALRTLADSGVGYDELPYFLDALLGAQTGVGGGANKTWTMTPSMTAANNPDAFSLDVGDDIQNWRLQYCMWQRLHLSAAQTELTMLEVDGFAQRAVKGAAASPANSSPVRIPGSLWTFKFASTMAGLPAAGVMSNFVLSWDLDVNTGLVPRFYLDGNLYFGQHVESSITGTIGLRVESHASTITNFYDNYDTQTMQFVRAKATGPVLGGAFYDAQIDVAVLWDKPSILAESEDGINIYNVTGRLAYDATSTNSIVPVIVNSISALT